MLSSLDFPIYLFVAKCNGYIKVGTEKKSSAEINQNHSEEIKTSLLQSKFDCHNFLWSPKLILQLAVHIFLTKQNLLANCWLNKLI